MSETDKDKMKTDLEKLASGKVGEVESIEELASTTLFTLEAQRRLLDGLRSAMFQEAAWLLRERSSDGIDAHNSEKLRECATRLSEAARTVLGGNGG